MRAAFALAILLWSTPQELRAQAGHSPEHRPSVEHQASAHAGRPPAASAATPPASGATPTVSEVLARVRQLVEEHEKTGGRATVEKAGAIVQKSGATGPIRKTPPPAPRVGLVWRASLIWPRELQAETEDSPRQARTTTP